jgi:hypothetical protein
MFYVCFHLPYVGQSERSFSMQPVPDQPFHSKELSMLFHDQVGFKV